MRWLRTLALGGAIAIAVASPAIWAWAQTTVVVQNLTGNEVIEVSSGGAGGQGFFTTVNAMRNATGYLGVATGTTVTTTVPQTAGVIYNTGSITTWNIFLPPAPYDGERVQISCAGGAASPVVGVTLPASVTIVGTAFTTCASGGTAALGAEFIYSTSANKWFRIQ